MKGESYKKINLKRGGKSILETQHFAALDNEDYARVANYTWYYTIGYRNHPPTVRCHRLNKIELDNFILKPKKGFYIYHINGDRLDCSRSNMVLLTKSQFEATKPPSKMNKSGIKGVRWKKK